MEVSTKLKLLTTGTYLTRPMLFGTKWKQTWLYLEILLSKWDGVMVVVLWWVRNLFRKQVILWTFTLKMIFFKSGSPASLVFRFESIQFYVFRGRSPHLELILPYYSLTKPFLCLEGKELLRRQTASAQISGLLTFKLSAGPWYQKILWLNMVVVQLSTKIRCIFLEGSDLQYKCPIL